MPEDTIPVKSDGEIEASDWSHYIRLLAWVPLALVIRPIAEFLITFAMRTFERLQIVDTANYAVYWVLILFSSWLAILTETAVLVVFLWIGVQCLRAHSE